MITAIVPAFNEENAIVDTLQEIKSVFESHHLQPYEIIVVDDGSTDRTGELARLCGVTVIAHPQNVGYGRSLKDGIQHAKFDTLVITDADRTYPFEQTLSLLAEYQKGFDMVVGARTGKHYKESFLKSPLRKILKFLVEFTAGRKIPDINSGLRIFSRKTVTQYLNHLCNTFSFTTSLTLAYMMTGKFVQYVPISYEKRQGKSKVKLLRDSLRTLQYILQAINYYHPMKIFLLFSMMCFLLSVISIVIALIFHILSGFSLGVGGLLVSVLILCFGLVTDLLKQIMDK
ncbi:MAG TPA: glycosyltransferase [Coxiellaceae bacterium]|nr:glycosyltransferase [Coxiellaceae bacterium]